MQNEQYIMSTKVDPSEQSTPSSAAEHGSQEGQTLHRITNLLEKRNEARTTALEQINEQMEVEIAEQIKTEKQLQNRIAFDHILTTISTQFINLATDEIDTNINKALEKVGQFTNYDRCYIFLFEENGRALRNTHEWYRSPHLPTLKDFRTLPGNLFQNWMPRLLQQETIYIQDIEDAPSESNSEIKLLQLQEVRSALIIPLVYDKETFGFFGLDSNQPLVAEQHDISASLKVVAAILVSALMRKKTEELLAEERNFAQQIMATMGQGVMTTTVEGIIDYANPACAHMLGFEPQALLGKTILDFTFSEEHPKLIQAQLQNMEGKASSYETCLTKTDNLPLFVLVNSVPNYNHQGRIIGTIATITDLTERRTAEAQIKANAEEVKEIYQAAIQLFRPSGVKELAKQIATITVDEMGFDSCGILLLHEPVKMGANCLDINGDNYLFWLAEYGRYYNNPVDKIAIDEEGLITEAVRRGEIIYAPDVAQDPRFLPHNTLTRSELVIPLRAYDLIIGAIDLQSPQLHGFDERSQRIITVFAEHAGLALETIRLYDQLQDYAQTLEIQINEREKVEQALRASEQRYKQFVENATDIIYRTDTDGYLTYVNPVTLRTLGYDLERDLIGQFFLDFVHPDFRGKIMNAYAKQQAKRIANTYFEFIIINKRGEQIWLGQNVQLIMEQDELVGFQALARDITQRRETEESLRTRSKELNATNAKLASAVRAKDEFLANMSHELRTPLNTILGKSEILLEGIHGQLNENQSSSLQIIEQSGTHLLELINDILAMAKIEADKVALDIQPASVTGLCETSLQFVRQMAYNKRIKLQANIDSSLTTIQADERRLKQILINLLSNAVKFTPEEGEVGLNVFNEAARELIRFQIWDTGIGISREDMDQLFKPFVQLDSSLTRSHEGTGLGLSLVYRLTDLHGGSVSLESQVGVGSCFTVTLPQKTLLDAASLQNQAREDRKQFEKSSQHRLHCQPGKKPLILLVEGNEIHIKAISEYLPVWGYRLTVARTGPEAMAKALAEKPNLILMDIHIPEVDGVTAVLKLRQEEALNQVPIIALTSLAMCGDKERYLEAGANDYLIKPIQLRQLVTRINELQLAPESSKEQAHE